MAIQKKDKSLLEFFDQEKYQVNFPHYMLSQIRKTKMMSKKQSSKPFQFNPQEQIPQWQGYQMQGETSFKKSHHQGEGYQGKHSGNIQTVADLVNQKQRFFSLNDHTKTKIMNNVLPERFKDFPKLISLLVY